MPDYKKSIGFLFLEKTKLDRQELFSGEREKISPVSYVKTYSKAPRYPLPRPNFPPAELFEVLARRRSSRIYQRAPLTLEELNLLLYASQGVTGRAGRYLLRTAPSAGALYPIETYLGINAVSGLPAGLYHLEVTGWVLEELARGEFGSKLKEAALGQSMCETASVVFIWSAIPRRTMSKYGSRGMRYIFMDVAHICQNLLLAAEALGLSACPSGAFFDEEINDLLGLDGEEETVIYLATVGRPKMQ
ncbi:SagB/ThcOx family dehydrogenase [Thermosulfurimonas dismutans]|uniref:Nitroreductase domain-containing protein n=1 Tax=Thermosulfurimonas dismutans TaxID=999894 RepID=A0A179D4F1_9BACT|nr:SagB/ThcOx family dehydrogenase [Thermosulfurimonas dismutans]OAQ20599.1 hypothetical protein TDIS_1368 [Thermosulfurimonas dismutans]